MYGRPLRIGAASSRPRDVAGPAPDILLPPLLDARAGMSEATERYRLLAIEQAERVARGSNAAGLPGDRLEARPLPHRRGAAVDRAIADRAPGLTGALAAVRRRELSTRPPRTLAVRRRARGGDTAPGAPRPRAGRPRGRGAAAFVARRLARVGARRSRRPPRSLCGGGALFRHQTRCPVGHPRRPRRATRTRVRPAGRRSWGTSARHPRRRPVRADGMPTRARRARRRGRRAPRAPGGRRRAAGGGGPATGGRARAGRTGHGAGGGAGRRRRPGRHPVSRVGRVRGAVPCRRGDGARRGGGRGG